LSEALSRIDAMTSPQAEAGLLSGVVVVARGDRVLFRRAYGYASWELRAPNTPATRFGIASITKPMTEVLIRLLIREGRIDPDAPVERYLARFPRGPGGGAPTVAHLLAHRAGVPHRVTAPWEEARAIGPANIVDRVRNAGLLFEPGTERLYSSAGFTCLARIVELVEGEPFHSVLAERVFRPAGMRSASGETGSSLMPDRALPHALGAAEHAVVVKRAAPKDLRFLTGAGSVYATADDLLRFARAVQTGVFGADLAATVFGGDPTEWHAWVGRTGGYEASVDIRPADDLIVVFLSNLRSAANWQVRERILSTLAGAEPVAIPLPPQVADAFEDPAALVGEYGPAEIRLEDGALLRGENEFYPINGQRYYVPASGTIMRFRRDSTGTVDALVSIVDGEDGSILAKTATY
jgi:D-alanyl-D-alanine carboxypeptidase